VGIAFQTVDMLPDGYTVPQGRKKPWGTGHAVLCAKRLIDAPFCCINADDYYGVEAFEKAYRFLTGSADPYGYMMVGYRLRNTLTETGYVSRGVCRTDENGVLLGITERTHIIMTVDGPMYSEDLETYHRLDPDTPVSMNMWGFMPSVLDELEARFPEFLDRAGAEHRLEKAEFFLPEVVGNMLRNGRARVSVLSTEDRWHGVTYREDRARVVLALAELSSKGVYPVPLWEE